MLLSTSLVAIPFLIGAGAERAQTVAVSDARAPVPGMCTIEGTGAEAQGSATSALGPTIAQMPGWPVAIGAHPNFAPWRSGVIEDLDRDGVNEVIVASTDSKVYAFRADGTALPGFPVSTIGLAQYAPSIADLEGDGDLEIVQFTRGFTGGGRFYIFDHTGAVLPGFPKSINNQNLDGSPVLADLDDDGALEILVPERAFPIGFLHVFEKDGSEWGGNWPVQLDNVPTGSPAVGDVDLDGRLEVVYLSYDSAYLLRWDGSVLAGWPKTIPGANFSYQSPALADLDQDGDLEVVLGAHQSAAGYYAFQHDGTLMPGWPKLVGTWTYVPPTVADLEDDGAPEILGGREGTGTSPSAVFWAWTPSGAIKPGFPYQSFNPGFAGGCGGALTVTDIDGDGVREIFSDHNVQAAGQGFVFGVNATGQNLPGFPLRPNGFTYQNGPTFGDVDGDGDVELLVLSYNLPSAEVNLYDVPGAFAPADTPWGIYHQDTARGGRAGGGRALFAQGAFQTATSPLLRTVGVPGEIASVGLSASTGNAFTAFGWWHLGPLARRPISNVVVPASGEVSAPFPLPPNPNLIGTTLYFQGLLRVGTVGRTTNVIGRTVH